MSLRRYTHNIVWCIRQVVDDPVLLIVNSLYDPNQSSPAYTHFVGHEIIQAIVNIKDPGQVHPIEASDKK